MSDGVLECKAEICNAVNQAYLNVKESRPVYAEIIKKTVELLRRRGLQLTAQDIADELGLAFRTYYYYLEKAGVTYALIVNAVKTEAEEKMKEKLERREVKRLPPKSKEEFMERDVVKAVIDKLRVGNVSETQRNRVINLWFRLCRELDLSPEDFFDGEEIKQKILTWLSKKVEQGYNKNSLIAGLQALQMWLEAPLLSAVIKQAEYKGEFTTAEIPPHVRDKIVLDLLKNGDELSKTTIKALMFLYYTGSRAEALTNYVVESEITINNPDMVRALEENRFVVVKTEEKGKKGKKYTWSKLIPASYKPLLPPRLTKADLEKVRKLLKHELMKYIDELNEDTKAYILDAKKSLHLMRHTSAREYLRAFKFNRYLVSKLLGWVKESNLSIYGDYSLLELLTVSTEEHKVKFVSDDVKAILLKTLTQ